ncbi:hypothetical protein DXG03_001616 [Asterophora parasitica]|uniref:Uncharacterized protein n=1 Tax=Asterophora parasitica TaxID=117018 RepID=A0A9P7G390_9AGAR|nr:hypothetical protein DXG03_001616 [Asterophora parasitica]
MFLAILKECPNLRTLSVNICPPIFSQELDEEIVDIQADDFKRLSIMTSVEPSLIFKSGLCLPRLQSLSLAWDRTTGQDFSACPDLKIDKLLENSPDLKSLSLSNMFPPKNELLALLEQAGEKLEELNVRADSTHNLLAVSLERLVIGKSLYALSNGGRLRTLDLSYACAELLTPGAWQLTVSFAKTTVEHDKVEGVHNK